MKVVVEQDPARSRQRERRVEGVWRRMRARYPLLKESAVIAGDGYTGTLGFSTPLLEKAIRAVRDGSGGARVEATALPAGKALRETLARLEATPRPAAEERARLAAMPVTPTRLYAYWRLPALLASSLRRRYEACGEEAVPCLRFEDVTGDDESGHVFDVEVEWNESERYVDLWRAGRRYRITYGIRLAERFVSVVSDAPLFTGTDGPRPGESRLRRVRPSRGARPADRPVSAPVAPPLPGVEEDHPERDLAAEADVRAAYRDLLRDGARALRDRPVPAPAAAATRAAAFRAREALRREAAERGRGAQGDALARSEPECFVAYLRERGAAPAGRRLHLPALHAAPAPDVTERLRRPGAQRWAALLETARLAKASDPYRACPAPRLAAPARAGFEERLEAAGVELEAELLLRGRVRPGRCVRIDGHAIEPDAEGRFLVACVLRDGRLRVPVEVVEAEAVTVRETFEAELVTARD